MRSRLTPEYLAVVALGALAWGIAVLAGLSDVEQLVVVLMTTSYMSIWMWWGPKEPPKRKRWLLAAHNPVNEDSR